jgi:hypothetical protein
MKKKKIMRTHVIWCRRDFQKKTNISHTNFEYKACFMTFSLSSGAINNISQLLFVCLVISECPCGFHFFSSSSSHILGSYPYQEFHDSNVLSEFYHNKCFDLVTRSLVCVLMLLLSQFRGALFLECCFDSNGKWKTDGVSFAFYRFYTKPFNFRMIFFCFRIVQILHLKSNTFPPKKKQRQRNNNGENEADMRKNTQASRAEPPTH